MEAAETRDTLVCATCGEPAIFKMDDGLACRQHVFADKPADRRSNPDRRPRWPRIRSQSP